MPAVASLPEQRVILSNTSWETYERLLAENVNQLGTRFFYDRGFLEIMVVSAGHEAPNRTLAMLVEVVAEETGRDLYPTGSTTFKRQDLAKGFEADSAYYLQHAAEVRGKDDLDLALDPPPDLVIEVDITRSSLSRFPIFAGVGVGEVWRYDGERVRMYRLREQTYHEIEASEALPPLTAAQARVFIESRRSLGHPQWVRSVREWVRANL